MGTIDISSTTYQLCLVNVVKERPLIKIFLFFKDRYLRLEKMALARMQFRLINSPLTCRTRQSYYPTKKMRTHNSITTKN